MRVMQIQEQIARGEYQVDTLAVADAIVRRLLEQHKLPSGDQPSQEECS